MIVNQFVHTKRNIDLECLRLQYVMKYRLYIHEKHSELEVRKQLYYIVFT